MSAVGRLFHSLQDSRQYAAGRNAHRRRLCRGANPNRIATLDYTAWQMGWDAEQDMVAGRMEP